jgi:osmotically-inducible protein OsmY
LQYLAANHDARSSMNTASKRSIAKKKPGRASKSKPRSAPARALDLNIVLVGLPGRLKSVERALGDFAPAIRKQRWGDDLDEVVDEQTVAIVVVEPLAGTSITRAVRMAGDALAGTHVSLFVVVDDGVRDGVVRQLYQGGASAVFEWPREAMILPQVLAELIGADRVRGRASEADRALERAVKVHLSVAAGLYRGLRVRARDGAVSISGTVSALWQKDEIEELAANVPGVTSVGIHKLDVAHSGISDRKVAAMIRSVLRNTTEVDDLTISITVRNGRVILAGSVGGRRELWRALKLISHVRGVRLIEDVTVVSSAQKKRDRTLARQIREALDVTFAGEEIDLAVFGGYVVLRGRVSTLGEKKRIERFIVGDPSVVRVVNKLEIRDR